MYVDEAFLLSVEIIRLKANLFWIQESNSPSALASAVGNFAGQPFLDVKRADFSGNQGFIVSQKRKVFLP